MAPVAEILNDAWPALALLGLIGACGLAYLWFKQSQSASLDPQDKIEGAGDGGGGDGNGNGG